MAIRHARMEQATLYGDTAQVAECSAELRAWKGRLPQYALGFVCVGLAVLAVGVVLLLRGA